MTDPVQAPVAARRQRRPVLVVAAVGAVALLVAGGLIAVPRFLESRALARQAGDTGFPMTVDRALLRIRMVEPGARPDDAFNRTGGRCHFLRASERSWKVCAGPDGQVYLLSVIYADETFRYPRSYPASLMRKVVRVVAPDASPQKLKIANDQARANYNEERVIGGAWIKTAVLSPIDVVVQIEASPYAD